MAGDLSTPPCWLHCTVQEKPGQEVSRSSPPSLRAAMLVRTPVLSVSVVPVTASRLTDQVGGVVYHMGYNMVCCFIDHFWNTVSNVN